MFNGMQGEGEREGVGEGMRWIAGIEGTGGGGHLGIMILRVLLFLRCG